MEWNAENVLDALNDFERKPELNPVLEEYLQRIAKNGEIVFPWCKLKPLLKKKLEVVLDEFYETCPVETSAPVPNFETFNFDNLKKTILQALDAFTSAPFTIQRLCELVTNPQKHYNRTDKYMRGIEKNVLVVSTIEPRIGGQGDNNNVNNNAIVNGMINDSPRDDNDTLNGHESESGDSVSSSNMNTSASHVLLENFANVFPSAACIPSASTMCMNREIDSNFISTSDTAEPREELEFDRSTSSAAESTETVAEIKDEAMDISDEESFHDHEVSMDNEETVSQELPEKDFEESNPDSHCDSNTADEESIEIKDVDNNEADISITVQLPPIEVDVSNPQVEVVSQSDDGSDNSLSQEAFEAINEPENKLDKIVSSSETNIKPCSPQELSSSLQEVCSPLQQPCSPIQQPCSPLQNPCSPVQGPCSPLQEPGSPLQEPGSPLQEPGSPLQEPGSPLQQPGLPLLKPSSPLQIQYSPPVQLGSPIQGPGSPLQTRFSPPQELGSPLQEPCSSHQETSDNVVVDSEMCVSESVQQNNELESVDSGDCN